MSHFFQRQDDGTLKIEAAKRGKELLWDALLNKGTAFTDYERDVFGLRGLLPARVTTLEEQLPRAYESYHRSDSDIHFDQRDSLHLCESTQSGERLGQ